MAKQQNVIAEKHLISDVVVAGGGIAGLCAAVAAARHGARTVLVQDRPVLGGNASSEIRMWIYDARGKNRKETGLLEELQLDNLYYNPEMKYPRLSAFTVSDGGGGCTRCHMIDFLEMQMLKEKNIIVSGFQTGSR